MENEVKEPAPKYNYISPEEYLALERKASFKSEYFHGQVLAMAGASLRHNLIESNIIGHLSGFLAGKNPDIEITPLNFHFSLDKCYQGTGL